MVSSGSHFAFRRQHAFIYLPVPIFLPVSSRVKTRKQSQVVDEIDTFAGDAH
jgi:hypothetical protein